MGTWKKNLFELGVEPVGRAEFLYHTAMVVSAAVLSSLTVHARPAATDQEKAQQPPHPTTLHPHCINRASLRLLSDDRSAQSLEYSGTI